MKSELDYSLQQKDVDESYLTYCCCSAALLCLTLWPHGLQHTRLPCLSLSLGACSNSCSLSQWCHPFRVFSNELALLIRWPKYWSFNFSDYSGNISFRIVWFGLLGVQGTLMSIVQHSVQMHQFKAVVTRPLTMPWWLSSLCVLILASRCTLKPFLSWCPDTAFALMVFLSMCWHHI